jgi:hypothetical protein
MGYYTSFDGSVEFDRPLAPHHAAYLEAFMKTRRMARAVTHLEDEPDPLRIAVGLPLGKEGAYFAGATTLGHESVLRGNGAPAGQPGLWCPWGLRGLPGHLSAPSDAVGLQIEYGKAYGFEEWLEYLIEHFFKPWGYVLNGELDWSGEDDDDLGTLYVHDNQVASVASVVLKPTNPFVGETDEIPLALRDAVARKDPHTIEALFKDAKRASDWKGVSRAFRALMLLSS